MTRAHISTSSFRATRGTCFSPSSLSLFFFLCLITSLLPLPASAQNLPVTGTPPFGSFAGGPDVIDLANLNVHLTIPALHKPGRSGMDFSFDLGYDTLIWYPLGSSGSQSWQPLTTWGWASLEGTFGYISQTTIITVPCISNHYPFTQTGTYYQYNWAYYDAHGVRHFFGSTGYVVGTCTNYSTSSLNTTAGDGSGYALSATGSTVNSLYNSAGQSINAPINSPGGGSGSLTDRNGNIISASGGVFTDTLGTTALTVAGSGTPSSPITFTYPAPSTGNAAYTAKYTTYSIETNFGCSGITEFGTNGTTTANFISEIDLPDGSKYSFTYEPTPGHSGFVTGRLASVTLPSGGSISYSYSGGSNGIVCADGSTATLTRTVSPGGTWTYAHSESGTAWTTLVTDPQSNQTNLNFQGIYETQVQVYQGSTSGTLLRQWTTCYNGNTSNCNSTAIALPITQRTVTDQYGSSGLQCEHNYFYNTVGGLREQDDYDYGSGGPGALLRKTLLTYAPLGNITAFRQTTTICNGTGSSSSCAGPSGGSTGTVVSQTNYNYDEANSLTATSGIAQHTSVSGSRGNLTSINYPVSGLTAHFTYYDTGSPNTTQDVNGPTTTYNYSNNTADCQMAFPTSISEPLSMSRSMTWNCTGGVLASVTDENNQVTSIAYSDPYFWRPASESFPDGGQSSWTYNSLTSITTTTKMNSSQNIVSTVLLDGLGRTSQTQLSDPQGPSVDYSVITYDVLGRPYKAYNPTRCSPPTTNCGEAAWGYTATTYDALGRPTGVTLQDGSVATASYTNNTVTVTDPASKTRQSTVDSLGRLSQVIEDPGSSPHLNYVTSYTVDALGNITSVTQNGGRVRSYIFDALSRLTTEVNPESGTTTYKYDSDSNCASPNSSAGDLISRTDARNIRTCLQYDTLHRLTQKNYSDGTLTAFFAYDQTSAWSNTLTNPLGRLTEEWTGTSCCATGGAEIFSYDPMGRITFNEQYTANLSYRPVNYSYDLAGDLLTGSNGVGITFSQSFDTAGRPTVLTSSLVDANHPATLATVDSSVGYYPTGALRKMTFGNGLTQTGALNNALQPCRVNVNSSATALGTCTDSIPSGNVQDFNYGFNSGSTDNGNVASWTATGQQAFSRTYSYDSLNRLTTLNQSSGNATGCSSTFNLSWTYDPWGNRTDQTVNSGTCNSFHANVNSQNQLSGSPYQYDAAGNMINDGNHTYFYDAENRLIQVDGTLGTCSTAAACYNYDAFGHRVEKATGSTYLDYIHDLSGKAVTEYCINCSGYTGPTTEYILMSGDFVAEYKNNTTYFPHTDHLGSARLLTDLNQSVVQNLDYLPFGELNSSDSGITTHKFTGDERDSETNLDHTWFRQYSSQLGRWMHPDPAGLAAVDPTNPQSWNRYAYVTNRPTYLVDPSGLCDVIVGGFEQTPGTAATDTQQFLAGEIGADQAYPYSGLNFAQSVGAAYGSVSPLVAADAIIDAANQSGGQPFTIYAFSGGAQAVADAWPSLPQSVQSQARIVYISPGHVPFGNSLPPGQIYQGSGPLDSFLTSLSPNGSSIGACGHDANCEFGALSDVIRNVRLPIACMVPSVFTRDNIVGGVGGGGAGGSGGGGASGSWDYPTSNPFGGADQGPGALVCHILAGVKSCSYK